MAYDPVKNAMSKSDRARRQEQLRRGDHKQAVRAQARGRRGF